jgi:rhodanese-related sulfurtransferase
MKKILNILAMAVSLFTLTACAANTAATTPAPAATPASYRKISAADAKARMDSGDEIIILDVRTKEEYDAGHIKGAILVPNESIVDKQPDLLPDLNAEILVYCRSGNRSAQAAKKLLAMGYTNVADFGGIIDWPYEVVID